MSQRRVEAGVEADLPHHPRPHDEIDKGLHCGEVRARGFSLMIAFPASTADSMAAAWEAVGPQTRTASTPGVLVGKGGVGSSDLEGAGTVCRLEGAGRGVYSGDGPDLPSATSLASPSA